MKKLISVFVCLSLSVCLIQKAGAQEKQISAADKAAIIDIFKYIDPSLYRLEFNKQKEVYGKRKFQMSELEQVRKFRNPAGENGYVVLISADHGVVFILAVTGNKLDAVLGSDKVARLNAIMAKYSR